MFRAAFFIAMASAAIAIGAVCLLPALAYADGDTIALSLKAKTPIHVALDRPVSVTHIGQIVTGTLVEPVYAYDRVVLPAGAPVRGFAADTPIQLQLAPARADTTKASKASKADK